MTIRRYITALQLATIGGTIGLGALIGLLLWNINRATRSSGWASEHFHLVEVLVSDSNELLTVMDVFAEGSVGTFLIADRITERCRRDFQQLSAGTPFPDAAILAEVGGAFERVLELGEHVAAGGTPDQRRVALERYDVAAGEYADSLVRLETRAAAIAALQEDALRGRERLVPWLIGSACALQAVLAVVLRWWATHRLVDPLRSIAAAAERARTTGDGFVFHECGPVEVRQLGAGITSLYQDVDSARVEALAADRAKSEFLANMSHEIRTPMTAILGFTENLLDSDQSESEKLNAIHTIRRNGDHLLGIINDILDLSKIEAGRMTVERIACHPSTIIAEVASLVRVRSAGKGLAFNIEYLGAIPETIRSDPTRLRQILINLIGNAIKFTGVGGIRLVTRLVGDGDETQMQFDVVDTGVGMSEAQTARLFRPFAQADTSTTRKFGGTGLGLAISKRFAQMLGGDVTVADTQVGVGTCFRVRVATGPLNGVRMLQDPTPATMAIRQTASAKGDADPVPLRGRRILLAEDGPDNQRLIGLVLKKAGAEVTIRENGKLAADTALAARDGGGGAPGFDVILMDMQMPVMDGYEATALLRAKGYTRPIIALTAHAMQGDRDKCIRAGCDDYATKPIDRTKLIALIREHACRFEPSVA